MSEINKGLLEEATKNFQESVIDKYSGSGSIETRDLSKEELSKTVLTVGQRNTTAIGNGETVEFFSKEDYIDKISDLVKVVRTTSKDDRTFDNIYVAANRYYKSGQKKVAEHIGFVSLNNMIRQHYEGTFVEKDGRIMSEDARRVDDETPLNKKLRDQRLPWNMLTEVLAGHKITASTSSDKQMYQKFLNRKPVEKEYLEQNYMVYALS